MTRLLESYIPEEYFRKDLLINKCRLLVNTLLITASFALAYTLISYAIDFRVGLITMFTFFILVIALPYACKRGLSISIAANIFIFGGFVSIAIVIVNSGGLHSAVLPWLTVLPITALLFLNHKYTIVWLVVPIIFLLVLGTCHTLEYQFILQYNLEWKNEFIISTISGLLFILFLITKIFEGGMNKSFKILSQKNKESEDQKQRIQWQNEAFLLKNSELEEARENLEIALNEVKEINSNLEDRVNERTAHIKKVNMELMTVNKELDFFIYRASHDLRGPIARLLGIAQLSKMDVNDQKALNYINLLEDNSKNLDGILLKLLSVNRIRNFDFDKTEWINFKEVETEIRKHFKNDIENHNIQIDFLKNTTQSYFSSKEIVRAIFINLVENSINFRKREHSSTSIKITLENDTTNLYIIFADDGIGISNEIAPYIYDMFFRGTELSQGNGLGLYIVKKAVDLLNGTITCKSEPNNHTSFFITLPFANVAAPYGTADTHTSMLE